MNVRPVVLKLGGSVITLKEQPLTPNTQAIRRLAKEISEANVSSLIIIHGGGSFGHPVAKKFKIKEGYENPSQIIGFSKTHQAMTELNRLVVDALIHHNIPALAVPPSSCSVTKSGRIQSMEERPLTKMLELGFVPVLYGDVVLDSEIGFTVLSGDQLVSKLAIKFHSQHIIIGVDVDGLFTADPKVDSSATLIQHATPPELHALQQKIEEAKVTDVTGGMLGKIVELMPAVEQGVPAVIVNASEPNNIYKALKGESLTGTVIEKR
ncbi:MAG: isopentenyl phosphate kinase [Thermoproteota archaeon]|nr:isopentenyl phosphate kinase [Thermoproteota archaeon]